MRQKGLYLNIVILGIIMVILAVIYVQLPSIEKKFHENTTTDAMRELSYLVENIERRILQSTQGTLYETLRNDKKLRSHLEEELALFLTPSIKYIYLLHKDDTGHFRFLLDASVEDKALFNQIYIVENKKWYETYDSKNEYISTQDNLPEIWISYLHPVVTQQGVEGMIAIDFSKKKYFDLLKLIEPIKQIFWFLLGFVAIIVGISIIQLVQYQIVKKRSLTDSLTGLYNRQFLTDFFVSMNIYNYQVLMLDLDHFKEVNDTYGHQFGDKVLQGSAKIIKEQIRDGDILVRYGGEEFLLFLYNRDSNMQNAYNIAERIRSSIEAASFDNQSIQISVTVSIGIEPKPQHSKNIHEAVKHADEMLYIAKHRGRNRIEVYEDQSADSDSEMATLHSIVSIHDAIENGRLFCHFQPITDKNKIAIHYEALVRISDEDGVVHYPNTFLPLIRQTSIYTDMTKAVLAFCFETFKDHNSRFSINLNFSDLLNESIFASITSTLSEHPEMAGRMSIELLEDEKIKDATALLERIDAIRTYGVRFAIDDFGSGYANFGNLLKLRFEYLKIDGELIKNITSSNYSQNIVESISLFAHKSGIQVIAEYVENQEIFDALAPYDIDYFQGYYLGKPAVLD